MQPLSITELVGVFSGHVALFAAPKESATRALPRGLSLGPSAITPPSLHPILVWFGRQRDVHLTHLRALPGFPLDYLEVIDGVPFVHETGTGRGPFLHLCQLYLDSAMAVFGGYTLWGFPKKMARVTDARGSFSARTPFTSLPILESTAGPRVSSAPFSEMRGARVISSLLAQPLIEAAMGNRGPFHVGSTFAWDLDHASAAPARARLSLARAFVPSLEGTHEVGEIDEHGLGAFHVTSRWSLSLPYPPSLVHRG